MRSGSHPASCRAAAGRRRPHLAAGLLALVAAAGVLPASRAQAASTVRVDPASQQFVTPDGRVLVMHGVNAVYKVAPFIPRTDGCDPGTSMCAQDIQWLVDNGFNAVRYGLLWEALMPEAGKINTTFLNETVALVRSMEAAGLYVLIDAHQDVFSERFCGEGFPEFAVRTNVAPDAKFPSPLQANLSFDPTTGLPTSASCIKNGFQQWLFAFEVNQAWASLFNESTGLRSYFEQHWATVAEAFSGSSEYVLGYELVNEPFVGNVYEDPLLLLEAGLADRVNLKPMYEGLNSAIRKHDPDRIVMYETVISGPYFGHKTGFTSGPGGPEANDKQALSVHLYCFSIEPSGDIKNDTKCNETMASAWEYMLEDIKTVGGGRALTEFGAVGDDANSAESLRSIMERADEASMSAFYWPFKSFHDITTNNASTEGLFFPNGTVQPHKYAALARPYPQKTPAVPSSLRWSLALDGTFTASYDLNPAASNHTAVMFAPSVVYGDDGPAVSVVPAAAGSPRATGQFIAIDHPADASGPVTVTFSKRSL